MPWTSARSVTSACRKDVKLSPKAEREHVTY